MEIIQVVDLFSGCGGLSYGFHKLENEFKICGAIDFDANANKTYEKNFNIRPDEIDLVNIDANILVQKYNLDKSSPILFIGGPPCQGFSSHKKKDKRKDARNSLVLKYCEIGINVNADVILMENVPDLFAKKHWKHYSQALMLLEESNYNVVSGIVNMAEFGVPQERFRAIVIAMKGHTPLLPTGTLSRSQFKTVRDAIGSLPRIESGEKSQDDPMHITSNHRKATIEIFKQIPLDGGSRPKGVGPKCLDKVKGFYDVYGRLFWDMPAVTITSRCRTPSCGRFLHPEQNRGLSVREAALLQGFPKDFYFKGTFDDKFKQIGNAVPPIFSQYLAKHVFKLFLKKKVNGYNCKITSPISNSFSTLIAQIKHGDTQLNDVVSKKL
jgi:DNA (cytosine-5)-methyltransferase 1